MSGYISWILVANRNDPHLPPLYETYISIWGSVSVPFLRSPRHCGARNEMRLGRSTDQRVLVRIPAGKVETSTGWVLNTTVYGQNPAPPGMYRTLYIMGYLPYQLVQDFVHQQ